MPWLTVSNLELADIRRAFPLMQLKRKELTLAEWAYHARRIIIENDRGERGFLAATDERSVIHGVLQYEVHDDKKGGRQLTVSDLVAHGHFQKHRRRVALALIQGLDHMAYHLNCRLIRIEIAEKDQRAFFGGLTSLLRNNGGHPPEVTFAASPSDPTGRLEDRFQGDKLVIGASRVPSRS